MEPRAEIVVDLAAIRHNVRRLTEIVSADGPVQMIAVVKADGYGHGMLEAGRAAREAGAAWLGVATIDEALTLRDHGDSGPLLCWLGVPGEQYDDAIRADVDVTAYTTDELDEIARAAELEGRPARVQIKVDTGLSRGGAARATWDDVFTRARKGEQEGSWVVTGIWSHFACADDPDHPSNDRQEAAFLEALQRADDAGLAPEVRHLANSAAAVLRPSARLDAVRCGIAIYGQDPAPGHTRDLGLVPAMTARTRLAIVKRLDAGDSVSYGHIWTASEPTNVGVVPVGYGDGVPRHASNVAEVRAGGDRRPIRGVVCMDQFVIDLGNDELRAGDEVELFGTGHDGAPTAQDWAEACGTINYEIVTRIGGRFVRRHTDSAAGGVGGTL